MQLLPSTFCRYCCMPAGYIPNCRGLPLMQLQQRQCRIPAGRGRNSFALRNFDGAGFGYAKILNAPFNEEALNL